MLFRGLSLNWPFLVSGGVSQYAGWAKSDTSVMGENEGWWNTTNNNNNCLKSNIQCIEIRVQWTVHLGSSHMHVHAVTRVHAVTPKLVICVMYLASIWRILLMTDGLNAVWSNDRAAHTDTNPKNLELAPTLMWVKRIFQNNNIQE